MVIDLMFKNGYKTSGFPLFAEKMAVAQMAQGDEAAGLLRKSTQGQLLPSFSHMMLLGCKAAYLSSRRMKCRLVPALPTS